MRNWTRAILWTLLMSLLNACGNGGSINFKNPTQTVVENKPSAYNYVPGSQALVVQNGHTIANGYHGKLEYNPIRGQNMQGPGGYKARMKFTGRNR